MLKAIGHRPQCLDEVFPAFFSRWFHSRKRDSLKLRPDRLTEVPLEHAAVLQLNRMLAEVATAPNRKKMEVECLSLSYRFTEYENVGVTPRQPLLSPLCCRLLDPLARPLDLEHAASLDGVNSLFARKRPHDRLGQFPGGIVVIKRCNEYAKLLLRWLGLAKRAVVNDPLSPNAGDFSSGR